MVHKTQIGKLNLARFKSNSDENNINQNCKMLSNIDKGEDSESAYLVPGICICVFGT